MNKLSIVFLMAALGSAAAFAQDVTSERAPVLNSKPQLNAQAREAKRPAGQVRAAGGDELNSSVDDAIGNDRAAQRGQQRAQARAASHPGVAPAGQGGTPDTAGAR